MALFAGLVARSTVLREDASLAAFYLCSLALGVLIVSVRGNSIDLLHVLFGTVLALDDPALILIGAIATLSTAVLAIIYRPLVLECFDPAVPALGEPVELAHPFHLPRARGDEPDRRLPGARHLDGGGHHAVAGDHRALLGDDISGLVVVSVLAAFAASLIGLLLVLLRQRADEPGHHPDGRRRLSPVDAGGLEGRGAVAAHAAQASRSVNPQTKEFVP